MYEDMTYETILQRMLDRVPDDIDKREGSIIYDALAPAALELQNMYIELDYIMQESFADTQSREYLVKRCAERGVSPLYGTKAIRKGLFNVDIPRGARFTLNELIYAALEPISDDGAWKMECETPGTVGNAESGTLIPIDYIDGLESAVLTDVLVLGTDDEDTEHLRQRYFDSLQSQAFGGNVADYRAKVSSIPGVGGVKVYRAWSGGGTVKLVIISSDHAAPSGDLINKVQTIIDPTQNQGQGDGLAPIGHAVTVTGVSEIKINISANLVYQDGWNWAAVKPYAEKCVDQYLSELAGDWANQDKLVVRVGAIETRLFGVSGILDIDDVQINGLAQNLILEADSIPVRGLISG